MQTYNHGIKLDDTLHYEMNRLTTVKKPDNGVRVHEKQIKGHSL